MELVVETRGRFMPCSLETFKVNGIDADRDDFGDVNVGDSDEAYVCENRRFEPKMPTTDILKKYSITLEEYSDICDALKDALYVSYCGMCI